MRYRMQVDLDQEVVQVKKRRLPSWSLRWLLGPLNQVIILIPGKTVEQITIKEGEGSNVQNESAY